MPSAKVDHARSIGKKFSITDLSSKSPLDLLSDVTLKEPRILKRLRKALKRTTSHYGVSEVKNIYEKNFKHKFTLIKNGESRCLLAFPVQILLLEVQNTGDALGALEFFRLSLCSALKRETRWNKKLYLILPTDFNHLPPERREGYKAFYRLTKLWEREYKIEVKTLQPELAFQDEEMIIDELKLQEKETSDLLGNITHTEKTKIVKILAGLDVWQSGATQIRAFVKIHFPEFKEWKGRVNLSAPPQAVAERFIAILIDRSIEEKDNSFGIFLNHLKEFGEESDMQRDKVDDIENVIKKYHLETDG